MMFIYAFKHIKVQQWGFAHLGQIPFYFQILLTIMQLNKPYLCSNGF